MFLLYYCSIVTISVRAQINVNTEVSTGLFTSRVDKEKKLRTVETEGCVSEEHPNADQKQSFEPDSCQHAIYRQGDGKFLASAARD